MVLKLWFSLSLYFSWFLIGSVKPLLKRSFRLALTLCLLFALFTLAWRWLLPL